MLGLVNYADSDEENNTEEPYLPFAALQQSLFSFSRSLAHIESYAIEEVSAAPKEDPVFIVFISVHSFLRNSLMK